MSDLIKRLCRPGYDLQKEQAIQEAIIEIRELRARIEAMEKQEPIASIYISGGSREFDDWKCDLPAGRNMLYALPGAQDINLSDPIKDERKAFREWFEGEQGVAYDGMWSFAKAAWMARAALGATSVKDAIIDSLQSQFNTEGITENDSGDALIRLSDAIAAVEDNFAQTATSVSEGWLRAVDEALVVAHIGVANAHDTYEQARDKLDSLIGFHIDVATDPKVNGGYKLVPIEPTFEMLHGALSHSRCDNDPPLLEVGFEYSIAKSIYAAMLKAAPKTEAKP